MTTNIVNKYKRIRKIVKNFVFSADWSLTLDWKKFKKGDYKEL